MSVMWRWLLCTLLLYPLYLGFALVLDFTVGDRLFLTAWLFGSRRELVATLVGDWGHALPRCAIASAAAIAMGQALMRLGFGPAVAAAVIIATGAAASWALQSWVAATLAAALLLLVPVILRTEARP